jgi:hypothetical protein
MVPYPPVGTEELRPIYRSGLRECSPWLLRRPAFYPALDFGYAERIARDRNTMSRSFAGQAVALESTTSTSLVSSITSRAGGNTKNFGCLPSN